MKKEKDRQNETCLDTRCSTQVTKVKRLDNKQTLMEECTTQASLPNTQILQKSQLCSHRGLNSVASNAARYTTMIKLIRFPPLCTDKQDHLNL